MRSYRTRVGPKFNVWCVYNRKKREVQIQRHQNPHRGKTPYEGGSRSGSDVALSKDCCSHQKPGGSHGTDCLLKAPEETNPADTLISDL